MWRDNYNPITGNRAFVGDSTKETKAGELDTEISQAMEYDPTVKNRFNDYKLDFNYGDMNKNLDETFNRTVAGINSDTRTDIGSTKTGTLRSLASRGITDGSIVDDTVNKNINPLITNKAKTIRDLGTAKLDKKAALMDLFNRYGIDITKNASAIDFQNVANKLSQNNLLGLQADNLNSYSGDTWLTDVLSGGGILADIFGGGGDDN